MVKQIYPLSEIDMTRSQYPTTKYTAQSVSISLHNSYSLKSRNFNQPTRLADRANVSANARLD